jgi:type I restriction enzyme S subunit
MLNDPLDNSMETELGALPSEWEIVPLGDLATLSTGGTPRRERPEYWNGTIPWVKTGEVNYGVIRSTEEHITEEGMANSSARLYPAGTLLVAMYGQGITRGRAAILGIEATINQACAAIRVGNKIDTRFLFFAFKHQYEAIRDLGHGANQRNLNMLILRGVKFPVPPLAEQQAIALVLRTVQQAKEVTETVIAAARQLKQSLMRHLFTYGPVPVEQADQVPLRDTGYGAVPETWKTMLLSECAVVQTGVAKGRKLNGAEAISVPYLRVANVQDGYLDLSEIKTIAIRHSELARFSLATGDVVLTEGGDFDKLGRGFIWNGEVPGCVHQNHIFAVRANRDLVMPEFLAYLTQSAYGKAYFLSVAHKTTNLACINTTKLKAFPALVPPKQLQQEIVASMKGVDQKIAVEVKKRNALDTLFCTLLNKLMTGKVRLSED